jgi:hypothetical protein
MEAIKHFSDPQEIKEVLNAMKCFQTIHNLIRKDFVVLLEFANSHRSQTVDFFALSRACLRGIFSLIEADIYGLNMVLRIENYNDRDSFEQKFKQTFKEVFELCRKTNIQRLYFDTKFGTLKKLKEKRDRLIHPKTTNDIPDITFTEFETISMVFNDYCSFIHELTSDFFISIDPEALEQLNKNMP